MLWIGVHLPALSLEAFLASLPEAGGPIALVQRQRLVAVNDAARQGGVRPGQSRATALALMTTLRLGEADAARDAAALQAVAHVLLAFTPAVSLAGTDTALAEVQASLRCFGGRAGLLARVRAALAPLGHRVQLACAPTARAAHWLARWRDDAGAAAGLPGVPVTLIDAAQPHLDALQTLGLDTAADLRRQPRDGLARRFGTALLAELDAAWGRRADPREPLQLPERFDGRLELFARVEAAEGLLAGAGVLLARLLAWAGARHGRIGGFVLTLHPESRRRIGAAAPMRLELMLAEPMADLAHLLVLLRERIQRVPLAAPVIELGLCCDHLVAGEAPNAELFPSAASAREGWQRLLERLEARLGAARLQRLEPVADHRPERATRCVPALSRPAPRPAAGAPARSSVRAHPGEPALAPRLGRPVWLLVPPRPLREQAGSPLKEGEVLHLVSGPERIETGWWDDDLVARDYFIAQDRDGALLWVYRYRHAPAPGEAGWYLHGLFG